jgi:Mg-chelatase subunit ChlD
MIMSLFKKQLGIFLTVIFMIGIFFNCVAFGAKDDKAANTRSKQQQPAQKFKIKLAPPAKTAPVQSRSLADRPVKKRPTPPKKIIPKRLSEIMFVLDNSGSMKKNDPNRRTKEVVTNFIKNLAPGSRIGMVIFGKEARLLEPITELTGSTIKGKFVNSLEQIDYSGQLTNTPSGIERAIYEIKTRGKENAEKAIILLTDGIIDTGDKNRDKEEETWLKEQLTRECQELGIKIYGIAFTDKADFRLMQIIASKTDGEYFRIYKAEEIQTVFNRISKLVEDAALRKETSPRSDSTLKTSLETKPQPKSKEPKKLSLRTESKSKTTVPPVIKKRTFGDIFPIIFLIAIILAVCAFFLMMYRTSKRKVQRPPARKASVGDTFRKLRPDIQAELIDVEHIIPQDSVSLTIDKASISIGRDSSNDIIIPEKVVSSLHATIEYRNGYYFLEDNRSTNGTRLNNRRLEQDTKMKLKSGDVIHFAKSEFRFLVHDQAPYGETMIIDAGDIRS